MRGRRKRRKIYLWPRDLISDDEMQTLLLKEFAHAGLFLRFLKTLLQYRVRVWVHGISM